MSELYQTSETSDAAPADAHNHQPEQPAQTNDLTRNEGTLEGDNYGGTLAAEEDGLPTRQEAREQARDENPEFYDENDLASYYDGDESTLAAEEDGLPTRQEAREQTWGGSPEYYDENKLAAGYDGDSSTLGAEEEGLPTRQEAWQQTWGDIATEHYTDTESRPDVDSGENERSGQDTPEGGEPAIAIAGTADADAERAATYQQNLYEGRPQANTAEPDGGPSAIGGTADGQAITGHDASAITHYHSEFKGHTLDIYTDGTQWATWDDTTPRPDALIAGKGEIPPERLPSGQELVDAAGEDSPMFERLRAETYRESEDALDNMREYANEVHDVFTRPPTGSHETVPADHPVISSMPYSGIDAGTAAEALFVSGLVAERAVSRFVGHLKHRRKE